MYEVLSGTQVNRWEMFQDLFTCLCILLSAPPGSHPGTNPANIPEELKLEAVKCLKTLMSHVHVRYVLFFSPRARLLNCLVQIRQESQKHESFDCEKI